MAIRLQNKKESHNFCKFGPTNIWFHLSLRAIFTSNKKMIKLQSNIDILRIRKLPNNPMLGETKQKYLFKTKKLSNAQVHRRMKPETTPTWTQSLVKVNSKSTVDMRLTPIINPWNSKNDCTLRF